MSMNRMSTLLLAVVFTVSASGMSPMTYAAESVPCAMVVKAERGFQLTYKEETVVIPFKANQIKTEEEIPVQCGSSISTHGGTAWIKTKNQVNMKFGPNSYFEFNKSDEVADYYTLYRGRMLLQSPPQKRTAVIYTPQAKVSFTGGVSWVEYITESKITQVASFNKSIRIQNRYNENAEQVIQAGEMSGLSFSDPRVMPKQPQILNSAKANELLTYLKLPVAEQNEMVEVADRVYEARSKSLSNELENWKDITKGQEEGRSLASETKKDTEATEKKESIETIQEREAAYVMEQFKKRVYGGVEQGAREPASVSHSKRKRTDETLADPEYVSQKKKLNQEKQKVLKKISDHED